MAHVRQSRPDSGLGFEVKDLRPLKLFPLRLEEVVQNPGLVNRSLRSQMAANVDNRTQMLTAEPRY